MPDVQTHLTPHSDDPDVLDVDDIVQAAAIDGLIDRLHSRWQAGTLSPAELEGLALQLIITSRGTSNGTPSKETANG